MNKKKTAVVTGASRGIGKAIAAALLENGWRVVLSSSSPPSKVENLLSEFKEKGYDSDFITCNIADKTAREYLIDSVTEKYQRIDLLVNNAGVAPKQRVDLLEMSEESFDYVLNINLKGTLFLSQKAAKAMIELKKTLIGDYFPKIINIASISSYTSSTNRGEYCISKAGISMTTQLFADRLAEYDIGVFEIRPGIIMTDMTAAAAEKYGKLIKEGLSPIPRFGRVEDVANCVMAVASGFLDFATGQIINADGGFHIRRL